MKLDKVIEEEAHRVLVYGQPGTGKTVLSCMLAKHFKRVFYIDLEKGRNAIRPNIPKEFWDRFEIIAIPDSKIYPIAIETLLKIFTTGGKLISICDKHGKVDCPLCKKDNLGFSTIELNSLTNEDVVIVDSGTQLSDSTMNFITKGYSDDKKPEWDDYAYQGSLLSKIFSSVQQANYNFVLITHEALIEMEDGKMKIVPSMGTSKYSKQFGKYFDHIVYCEVKNRKHYFYSSSTALTNVMAKSRTNVKLEDMPEPELVALFKSDLTTAPKPANIAVSNLQQRAQALLKKS